MCHVWYIPPSDIHLHLWMILDGSSGSCRKQTNMSEEIWQHLNLWLKLLTKFWNSDTLLKYFQCHCNGSCKIRHKLKKKSCIHTCMSPEHPGRDIWQSAWHYRIWSGPSWYLHKISACTSYLCHSSQNMHSMDPTLSLHSLSKKIIINHSVDLIL